MFFIVSYALRLFGVVGRWLKNGFNRIEEEGHELVELVSAAVPHHLGSIVHHVSQVHDRSLLSY
jgi:hypothetical protein